jgi:Protein of unknown function (DUF3300)
MKQRSSRFRYQCKPFQIAVAVLCVALLAPGNYLVLAQQADSQVMTTTSPETTDTETATDLEAPIIPAEQLDALVAPIALYPDPLLAQTLAASTYPLEIVQLQQWMEKNKDLKDKALADAVAKQPWDPSIQGLAAFPDVVTMLGDNVAWTTDLGNAFLAQEADVMAAVQRMRAKAQGTGALKTSAQQVVQTETVGDGKQVIAIQPASPDVVYVPSYDPVVVYGASYPAYPYPPVYYPGYVAGVGLAFGAGLVLGSAWGGGWGYGCGWGHGNVNVNVNNRYVNNYNRNNANINRGGGNWQHNANHRGPVPYNKGAANKYGQRPGQRPGGGAGQAQRPGQRPGGGVAQGNRPGSGTGQGNRPGGSAGQGNRPGSGAGQGNRPGGGAGQGNRPGSGAGQGNRPGGGASTKPATRPSSGAGKKPASRPSSGASSRPASRPTGGNSIGGRNVSKSSGHGAFGGASSGMNKSSARASSSRGSGSMGGSRGGGGRRR